MRIETILAGIKKSQEKVAEVATPAPTTEKVASPTTPATLLNALNDALAPTKEAQVAPAASNPVQDVMKVAAELESAEKEAELKHAALLGQAFADAAIARAAEWQKQAAAMATKEASEDEDDPQFAKFAAENPQVVREAAARGYQVTRQGLEKMAEDAYVQGYNDTVTEIHKVASYEFMKAAAVTAQLLEAASKQG